MDAGRLGKFAAVPCFVALQECKTGLFPLVLFLWFSFCKENKMRNFVKYREIGIFGLADTSLPV